MKIHSPIYSVVQPKGMFGPSSPLQIIKKKKRCFQLLVNSFAHCVQAVLWAPHCADGGLHHLKGAGLPGVSVDHAPNTGHHR